LSLTVEKTGTTSLNVHDDRETICEIRDLRMQNVRFRKGGRSLIGRDVPLPLYWEQYANHEDPERNCGSHGKARVMEESPDRVVIQCTGMTLSGSVLSEYVVTLARSDDRSSYVYDVEATLKVQDEAGWSVTYNPNHGELEFCNLWPEGVFSADPRIPLRYDACYIVRPDSVLAVSHHHLESSDKHNILLEPGDRMAWLLDEENLCVEVLSGGTAAAGVCAYMWDAHIGYRLCIEGKDRILSPGFRYMASFRLLSPGHAEGDQIARIAQRLPVEETEDQPVIVEGIQTFGETIGNTRIPWVDAWPWETAVISGDARNVWLTRDRETTMRADNSLRIDARGGAHACWKATALGPAFRQPPFITGQRYRLVASVRTRLSSGNASVAIRLHRTGEPGLFDPETYELFRSEQRLSGSTDWTRVEVVTPFVAPAPDRVHLLLEVDGAGSCWFTNVQFTREK
jgi:hypothetical protein